MKEKDPKLSNNSVSLAGEFAVLSQLSLRGYDANMTLGNTKNVDILAINQSTGAMTKIEVKTNYRSSRSAGGSSKLFGDFVSAWIMGEKHETITDKNLFYCFVSIGDLGNQFRFFIIPNKVVAKYVQDQHQLWLDDKESHSRENKMRTFRLGKKGHKYPIPTPTAEEYENKWELIG